VEWRRYFEPEERDRRLSSKLMGEAPGILAWAVRGAMLWYAEDSLREPESVTVATAEYRDASDILASFYPGTLVDDAGSRETLTRVYFAFIEWADTNGIENYSRRWLRANLETRGVVFKKMNDGQNAMGVSL
jgi:putative DNA primase/helicase